MNRDEGRSSHLDGIQYQTLVFFKGMSPKSDHGTVKMWTLSCREFDDYRTYIFCVRRLFPRGIFYCFNIVPNIEYQNVMSLGFLEEKSILIILYSTNHFYDIL